MFRHSLYLIAILFSKIALAQSTDKIPDQKEKLTCKQMLQLIDLASKKFETVIGERYWHDSSSNIGDHFYSKLSFGLQYSAGLSTYNLPNEFVAKDVPYMRFNLYFGSDSLRSQIEYRTLIDEFNKCLAPLGFEKRVDRRNSDDYDDFDHYARIKVITEYRSQAYNARFRLHLSEPSEPETRNGKKYPYPTELINVEVFYY